MKKLKLQIQMSLDGFIAGPNGESEWVFASGPDAAGFQKVIELAESSDTLLLGRKMAPEFIAHWENIADNQPDSPQHTLAKLMVNIRKIVFTRTGAAITGRNVTVANGDLATTVQALKQEPGKDMLVYGGAGLANSLIEQNLVDEYFIFTCPVAIGAGLPIFKDKKTLKLESSTAYNNGKVLNKYLPA